MKSPIKSDRRGAAARAATPDRSTHRERRRSAALTLDANALELFARVAAAGSFAEAARRLGQTRAAVSRRIAAIEALAGQALMARTTRSLGLTEAGRRLAQRARAVHEAADAARGALQASRAGLAGRLRVTAVPSFGRAVLAPLLARFRERHPGVQFELLFTDRRVDLLRDNVDVAFRLTRTPPEDWVAQPVLPFVVRAYAAPAPAWPLAHPRALATQPLLLVSTGSEVAPLRWQHGASGKTAQVDVAPVVTSEDMDGLMALARAGAGIVLAPSYCAQVDLMQDRLVDVLPGWHLPVAEGAMLQALTLPQPLASESARSLVRFVREALAASPLR
ncbi:MAG: LysR substrate-binding domain-containing protein [Pseudomonadota bacterium]